MLRVPPGRPRRVPVDHFTGYVDARQPASKDACVASLLQQIAEGDASAVERLVDAYGGLIWSMAGRYLDRADAAMADAVQEIFVEIWMSAGRYDPARGPEIAFVTTIARRRFIDAQRRIARLRRLEASVAADDGPPPSVATTPAGPGHAPDDAGAREELLAAFDRLPGDERTVLWLFLHHGLSHDQISTATDAPLGTVKSRIRRGLLRLRSTVHAPARPEEATS